MLEKLFGPRPHFIQLTTPSLPHIVLQYSSLRQITDDIDDARVYGGIHFRFDQEAGDRQGTKIGRYVVTHNLRRVFWRPHDFD